jgi:hypothetical protein
MKRTIGLLVAVAVCSAAVLYADYGIVEEGTWPKDWPQELDSLRKQARTYDGPIGPQLHYEIPFASREQFEAAWPHLLAVTSQGAPLVLVRGPQEWVGAKVEAGVRIHANARRLIAPEPGEKSRSQEQTETYLDLIVDGDVVDLNRIPLPPDTPIIDKRFERVPNKR